MKNILGTEEPEFMQINQDNPVTKGSTALVRTFKNLYGYSEEYTYDSNDKELTYKNSNGVRRGFDIPEYTMEELVSKLGNFKIKK